MFQDYQDAVNKIDTEEFVKVLEGYKSKIPDVSFDTSSILKGAGIGAFIPIPGLAFGGALAGASLSSELSGLGLIKDYSKLKNVEKELKELGNQWKSFILDCTNLLPIIDGVISNIDNARLNLKQANKKLKDESIRLDGDKIVDFRTQIKSQREELKVLKEITNQLRDKVSTISNIPNSLSNGSLHTSKKGIVHGGTSRKF